MIVVVNDTMRRDRVGIHGGSARTPVFDRFAEEGLWFTRAYSQAPWTKPAIATLFTSLYPSQHGLESHPEMRRIVGQESGRHVLSADVLPGEIETLAEALSKGGYRTAAVISNPWMLAAFGFDQGFDEYDEESARWHASGGEVTAKGLSWLERWEEESSPRPFFLYLHYIDSHQPYGLLTDQEVRAALPELRQDTTATSAELESLYRKLVWERQPPFEKETRRELRKLGANARFVSAAYDRGIEDFDTHLGELLAFLRERPYWERTAMIVTSDHGEALFERGWGNHGLDLFAEETAIPLAMRIPGRADRIDTPVGLIDLYPTICAYLSLACPENLAGRDLFHPEAASFAVSEGVMFRPNNRVYRTADRALFHRPDGTYHGGRSLWELYDLGDDPSENHDLLSSQGRSPESEAERERLAAALEAAVHERDAPEPERAPVDAETERRLRAIGYLN